MTTAAPNVSQITLAIGELEQERAFLADQLGRQADPVLGGCIYILLFNLEKRLVVLDAQIPRLSAAKAHQLTYDATPITVTYYLDGERIYCALINQSHPRELFDRIVAKLDCTRDEAFELFEASRPRDRGGA